MYIVLLRDEAKQNHSIFPFYLFRCKSQRGAQINSDEKKAAQSSIL